MAEITYKSIEPLIAGVQEDGDLLVVGFTCPVSEVVYEGTGQLQKGRTLADVSTERGLVTRLRRSLGSLLLGSQGGTRRSARAQAGKAALTQSGEIAHTAYTESERKAAVVLAFQSVANRFVWDAKGDRWIAAEGAKELLTEFTRQLEMAPASEELDRKILSRMLVEVARADGKLTPAEWQFLGELIPGDTRSVDTNMELPNLTDEELDQASRGACRDTMLMLAWALALTDEDLDVDEDAQLMSYAKGLKIPESRAHELRAIAAGHLLEDAFQRAYPKGKLKKGHRKEAFALGGRAGLSREEVEAFESRFKHRHGFE